MCPSRTDRPPIRIGVNGFGRIGRSVTRAARSHPQLEIVGINDVMDADTMRYLLAHDSVMGRRNDVALEGGHLITDDRRLRVLNERAPDALPWDELDVDVALECTGQFRSYEAASQHRSAGAEKVVISAPPSGDRQVPQIVVGANHERYDGEDVVSVSSCTTNSVAPVLKVLVDRFGIERGVLTTVHAYTSSQNLVDGAAEKRRRGRAAAENIVPTTTGAARATTEILPELAGRLDGMAMRVPVPNGSISDLSLALGSAVDRERINQALREAARGELAGILACTGEEIVSRDVIGLPCSSLVDLPSTMVIDDDFVKLLAWYDNEYGFSHRLLDVAEYITIGEATPERAELAAAG